ncbi:MAG TPA: hypothetical protein VGM88_09425 [Kofleriaceae bacterium]|jgi:dienelactone hydrolase
MSAPAPEPGFFGPADRPRFGWLHRPASSTGIGLVIVPPFGYEAVCAHRSLRHLAVRAAQCGLIAVRPDLDGTGDAAGSDLDPHRVDAWLASIADACDLARTAGADRLVLAGVRLGAALAALAASRRTDVAGVISIAGISSGRAYVREGRALQMALGLAPDPLAPSPTAASTTTAPAPTTAAATTPAAASTSSAAPTSGAATTTAAATAMTTAAAATDEVGEIVGFAVTGETKAELSAIELTKLRERVAPAVLIIDRDDMPGNDKWAAQLRATGAEVEQTKLPGYVEMVLDPHRTVVPTKIIEAAVAFAAARPALATPAAAAPKQVLCAIAQLRGAESAFANAERSFTEEPLTVDGCLFGIVSRPSKPATRGVVLLNAGAVGRIGPNRLYVALARRLAAQGVLVLRVDQSGIGDSPARPGGEENLVYSDQAIGDALAAVAWIKNAGAKDVAIAGLCSGAYHSLKAAVAGAPVTRVVPINPLTFHYEPGAPLDVAAFRVTADAKRYEGAMRSADKWKKVLRGEVDVRRVAKVVATRARHIAEHRARDILRRLRVPLKDDLGTDLLALARRGIGVRFVFAASDPGHAMLVEQGGMAVPRLANAGSLAITMIDGPDHTFTARWTHERFLDAVAKAVAP